MVFCDGSAIACFTRATACSASLLVISPQHWMQHHRRFRASRIIGLRGRIGDRSRGHVFLRRKCPRERPVHPFHDPFLGTEVHLEVERLKPDIPDALVPDTQEQTNLRLAEAVNGLHRITHDEQTAPVSGCPARREQIQKLVLAERSILELVDQHMLDPVIKREREIRRFVAGSQRAQRAPGHLCEIHLSAVLEHHPKFRDRQRQQLVQCLHHLPLAIVVPGWR